MVRCPRARTECTRGRGFDQGAEEYEPVRPDYPKEALAHLARGLGPHRGWTSSSSRPGPASSTRGLLPFGVRLVAIEPSAGMRATFHRTMPGVPVEDGTAESIPRPDGSAQAVVVGQAFHWFRSDPALREINRVLRPQGGLASSGIAATNRSHGWRGSERS